MESRILLRAGMKRHKGSLIGIFILILMVSAALSTVLAIGTNGTAYIQAEMNRIGYGDVTAWVSDVPDLGILKESISRLNEVGHVEDQRVIYTNYEVNNQESDSEGQFIPYESERQYRFFREELSGYQDAPRTIEPGQVYVSPSMVSMMDVQIGDKITFPIARNGGNVILTVAGYYEDPFMGSSMIGMKGFLIAESEYGGILEIIEHAGMDALARGGAMLHLFAEGDSQRTTSELNQIINEQTGLLQYTEFVHSSQGISGFMLILQNAFGGLLAAFAGVLLLVAMVVMGHSISALVEQEYANMGILKTVGMTGGRLIQIQVTQYLCVLLMSMAVGIGVSVPISRIVSQMTLTATGILVPSTLPVIRCLLAFAGILLVLLGFAVIKLRKIGMITPMKAIRGETGTVKIRQGKRLSIGAKGLEVRIAVRQLCSGKHRYLSACIVAVFLTFFASLVGRMDSWLGPDGKGMMDAFNPANHDIGVQALGELDIQDLEHTVRSYTDITDSYLLAMPEVSVNGINYTANVITNPERFHIIEGETSMGDDEIVLTQSASADLGVSIGDAITVRGNRESREYTISGIYQCANDMGNNIGMSREGYLKIGQDDVHLWCYHYFLEDPSRKTQITETLERTYGGDVHVHENTWPGLFGIISAMRAVVAFMYGMVFLFILIVTIMTGSKILSAEQKDMGIYKAIGFSTVRMRFTFALRFAMVAILGSGVGTILAACITDPLVSSAMRLAGISSFSSSLTVRALLMPAAVVSFLFTLFGYFAAGKIKKVDMTVLITEV